MMGSIDKRGAARRPIALLVFVVAMLCGAVPSALAATKTEVTPAQTISSFVIKASRHYHLEFRAVQEGRGDAAKVTVEATSERHEEVFRSVTYSTRGRLFGDGGFVAKLSGVGRVAVHFKEEAADKTPVDDGPYCPEGMSTTRRGVFVGSVGFRGTAGFTTAKARRADGHVLENARLVCHVPVAPAPEGTSAPAVPLPTRSATIYAFGPSGPAAITFSSAASNIGQSGIGAGGLATIDFQATYRSELRGVGVSARVYVTNARSTFFSVPAPAGALTDATITPPKPFSGSGIFHLETPTSASWTGDLAVAMPGVGTVPLTGPGIAAQLCEESCAPAPTAP
jgi:hypothetical protein